MRDVTAILMGDPAARFVRVPTPQDIARTAACDLAPCAKRGQNHGRKMSPLGRQVRAMNVGDRLVAPTMNIAKGLAEQMNRFNGWYISCRTVQMKGGGRAVEMTRVR